MLGALLDIVLPRLCAGCGCVNPRGACRPCLHRFRPVGPGPVCFYCRQAGRSRSRSAGLTCTRLEHRWAWGRAAFWMEAPLDGFIHALKYRHAGHLGLLLGRRLARSVPLEGPYHLTGVPLTPARRRERGYNQTELLLAGTARVWGFPTGDPGLRRVHQGTPQARLDLQARTGNIQGSFGLRPGAAPGDRSWVVLDDVATTGATFVGVLEALREGGAKRACPVALALA